MPVKALVWSALATVPLAAIAYATVAVSRHRHAQSATVLLSFNEAFRRAWRRYLDAANPDRQKFEFNELANLLEIGCGIYRERSVVGFSRKVLGEYLDDVVRLIHENPDTSRLMEAAVTSPTTFEHIRRFRAEMGHRDPPAPPQDR